MDDLKTLRQRVEESIRASLPKMHDGEMRDLGFAQDFHGDVFKVRVVKGYSPGEVASITGYFRTYEAGRYDGFNADRDLEWTVNALLNELGL